LVAAGVDNFLLGLVRAGLHRGESIMSDDQRAADHNADYDPRRDVILDRNEEHASPDRHPRMFNTSAGLLFFRP